MLWIWPWLLRAGSDTAYKAVMKPVEGTILTVIREIAQACEKEAKEGNDIVGYVAGRCSSRVRDLGKNPFHAAHS